MDDALTAQVACDRAPARLGTAAGHGGKVVAGVAPVLQA